MVDDWVNRCLELAKIAHALSDEVFVATRNLLDGVGSSRKLTSTELAPFVAAMLSGQSTLGIDVKQLPPEETP